MFGRRRSFKVGPGIKVNTGKRGITSVNVAGVKLGTLSRGGRSGGRKPTKADQQAKFWRIKPGLWYVRFETGDDDYLNLEVRGSEITYDRFKKMSDAAIEKNATTEARIFRQIVASWDLVDEKGKIEPISAATLQKVSNGFFFGLTVEIVNALEIPNKSLDSVLLNAKTDKPYPINVSNKPLPNPSIVEPQIQETDKPVQPPLMQNQSAVPEQSPRKQGKGCARKLASGLAILFIAFIVLLVLGALL